VDTEERLAGQRDCKEGNPHQPGRSEDYNLGYAEQYELEQLMNAWGMR